MTYRSLRPLSTCLALLFSVLLCHTNVLALEPQQIALIVNTKVPEGRKLAEYYASQRHIPENRIIELSLSTTSDDLDPVEYDEKVVPAVREFLNKNNLQNQVTCLVTFWGMPLRISRRTIGDIERRELADLKDNSEDVRAHIEQQVKAAEALAKSMNADHRPGSGVELDDLARRTEVALNAILHDVEKLPHSPQRDDAYKQMMDLARDLAGAPAIADKLSQSDITRVAPKPATTEEIIAARNHVADVARQINAIEAEPQTAASRAKLRELFKAELGGINYDRLLVAQTRALDIRESESAFDNELALLWWPTYPKSRWTLNPLDWHLAGRENQLPKHTLMVMRLDGPTEQSVHNLIESGLKVEADGLTGEVVLDARGKPPTVAGKPEPYGVYDQAIRDLAELLRTKTSLKVVLDDKESLIPQDSEKNIAIYCGWYSLRIYVSPGDFAKGAVGFHVASSEMVSLHDPQETGWCHNLLNAGVVATLGPVAEPYLQSFPPADEFFPLLMTGKLSLAEVYWKTTPWTSWMQCCVGDPLYCPYKTNPPLKVDDLPKNLKHLIAP